MATYLPGSFGPLLNRWDETYKKLKSQKSDIPSFNTEKIIELFGEAVNLLKLAGDMLEFVLEEGGINGENQFVLYYIDDTLEMVSDITAQINGKLPLFLEDVTVFNEKLFEKLEQLKKSFDISNLDETELSRVDFNELAYVLREVEQTLDFLQVFAKKLIDKVA
jgi:hypothetical protein